MSITASSKQIPFLDIRWYMLFILNFNDIFTMLILSSTDRDNVVFVGLSKGNIAYRFVEVRIFESNRCHENIASIASKLEKYYKNAIIVACGIYNSNEEV